MITKIHKHTRTNNSGFRLSLQTKESDKKIYISFSS